MMKLKSLRLVVAAVATTILLTACDTPTRIPVYPEITWTHVAPMTFDVGKIEIVNKYRAPLKSPNVEHEFPIVPEQSIKRWISDRLRTSGGPRTLRVTIRDAAVVGKSLKVKDGVKGLFYKEQAARYTGNLDVLIEVRGERGFTDSAAEARVKRSRSVPEETSPNDLDQIFFDLTAAMMKDLDRTLEANIRKHMARDLK
jgi:hypothetical protein